MEKNEISTALFIAKKNLMKNKGSIFLTLIIISLGFISSIIIYGVLKDTGYDMQENFIESSVGHITIEPYGNSEKIKDADSLIRKIKTISEVIGVARVSKTNARLFDNKGNFVDLQIYIVDPREYSTVSVVDEIISDGSWLSPGQRDKIFIGCVNIKSCSDLTAFPQVDLRVGENFKGVVGGVETNLSLQGIYDHRLIQVETIAYISEDTAKEIFSNYDSNVVDEIIILLPNRDYTASVREELEFMNLNAEIKTWEDKASGYTSIIDSFLIIGNLSFLIGVIISAISIYVILYVNILNKRTQIGIIKALGIKSRVVSLSYFFLSLILGIVGSIMGFLLTLLLIQYFTFYPINTGVGDLVPRVTLGVYILVASSIILASVVSGYLVSKRITKENIIGAIFHG